MAADPGKLILIVDDEEAIVLLLETILSVYNYRSVSCMNPNHAIKMAQELQPDLIILDIAMPEIDGYEICAKLKADKRTEKIPVIMVTALALSQDRKTGLECGAEAFIFKPFDPQTIIKEIEKLIN